jgi:hypothetical protein
MGRVREIIHQREPIEKTHMHRANRRAVQLQGGTLNLTTNKYLCMDRRRHTGWQVKVHSVFTSVSEEVVVTVWYLVALMLSMTRTVAMGKRAPKFPQVCNSPVRLDEGYKVDPPLADLGEWG